MNDIDFEQELYNHFGQVKDFTLGMRIGQYFYELGKQSGSSEIPNALEEAAEKSSTQYYQDAGYSPFPNVETAAHKSGFIAGAKWQKEQMISALKNDGDLPIEFIDKFHEIDRNAFQNGQANMKEQMLKDGNVILTEEDFEAEKEKSMEWGYNLCKEQMMKGAVEGEVMKDINNKLAVTAKNVNLDGFKFGEKVRIIIVKED